ncbi:GGDEF domain-containing protein [Polynucleobacter bastaniensis]|jgi:diguanylate cyclase (GGDEF)-like protein|uniref:GGDEF domain-containing protein n=1 Tax=Polynucleobacter bastaniensis TaxID=2081039 RepID=UPI001C0C2585|nr:GGDEF domain-containing protein [Polynucleobacter bastaniensis]MBU3598357.1 GGDEF domain-containing protein [Polynucleobacter bastaniensis]
MEESLNENNSNLITSSAADSIQAAEYFSNLVANLQQFVQTANQNDLLKYFHEGSNTTAVQRRILDLMIYGEEFGIETRHDHLTGLLDRTSFLEKLKFTLAKTLQEDHLTAIIFVDLDNFKAINDQYGHSTGDEVISIIGRRISASIRAQDLACRWGGDEFVLALQAITSKDLVSQLANRLLAVISQALQLGSKESLQLLLGASVGIAIMDDINLSSMDLVERADKAMYLAKKAGKNCIEFYS